MTQDNQQHGSLRPHEIDGIQECDNPLPTWWVWLFILTIAWGAGYIVYFHLLDGPSQIEHFNQAELQRKSAQDGQDSNDPADIDARIANFDEQSARETFSTNCAACHQENGSGLIGPNLTDKFWIHGGRATDIINVIEVGVLEKGMPPWKDILGRKKIEELAGLIVSWRDKNLPGKAAEGEAFEP